MPSGLIAWVSIQPANTLKYIDLPQHNQQPASPLISSGQVSARFRAPTEVTFHPMTPVSQAAASTDFAAQDARLSTEPVPAHPTHQIHAPSPGTTATLINDMRELFKVRVTGMVVITGWAGFYLGSMQSGISSVQRGLLDTLVGIGLGLCRSQRPQSGTRAHHRRAHEPHRRPPHRRWPHLAHPGNPGRPRRARPRRLVAACCTPICSPYRLALLTAFSYVAIYTPLKRVTTLATFIGAFPGAMGPMLGWTAARGRIEWPAVALFAILFVWQFPHFMAIAWLYRDDYARAGIRMLPVVQPDGWSTVVEALFYAVVMIPVSLAPMAPRNGGPTFTRFPPRRSDFSISRTPSASPAFCAPPTKPKAAWWHAICSR